MGWSTARWRAAARAERLQVVTDPAFDAHRHPAAILADAASRPSSASPTVAVRGAQGPVGGVPRPPGRRRRRRPAPPSSRPSRRSSAVRACVDHGLAHYRGRSVVDLRPPEAGGKREAVERLIARHQPGAVAVLGDEMSDVDAFEAVIAARRRVAPRVGDHGRRPRRQRGSAGELLAPRRPVPRRRRTRSGGCSLALRGRL